MITEIILEKIENNLEESNPKLAEKIRNTLSLDEKMFLIQDEYTQALQRGEEGKFIQLVETIINATIDDNS